MSAETLVSYIVGRDTRARRTRACRCWHVTAASRTFPRNSTLPASSQAVDVPPDLVGAGAVAAASSGAAKLPNRQPFRVRLSGTVAGQGSLGAVRPRCVPCWATGNTAMLTAECVAQGLLLVALKLDEHSLV